MGKRGKWLSNIKKALSPDSKRKDQKSNKLEKKSLDEQQQQQLDANSSSMVHVEAPSPPSQVEGVKLIETINEENNHAYSVPVATTAEASPALDAIQPAMAVVQVAKAHKFAGRSEEEVAAIQIQTAFRGYMVCIFHFSCKL
uniref:Uncharacterized protein n=1 Tax=Rhizophora mucronata TaxID=61149 RepID=A0A2P2JWN2_RHIMU